MNQKKLELSFNVKYTTKTKNEDDNAKCKDLIITN